MQIWLSASGNRLFVDGQRAKRRYISSNTRRIFFTDKLVVKVEKVEGRPPTQCEAEYRKWRGMKEEDRKWFVPILDFQKMGNFVLVVEPRLQLRRGRRKEQHKDFIHDIALRHNIYDIFCWGESTANWGVTKEGQPIIYDYGI